MILRAFLSQRHTRARGVHSSSVRAKFIRISHPRRHRHNFDTRAAATASSSVHHLTEKFFTRVVEAATSLRLKPSSRRRPPRLFVLAIYTFGFSPLPIFLLETPCYKLSNHQYESTMHEAAPYFEFNACYRRDLGAKIQLYYQWHFREIHHLNPEIVVEISLNTHSGRTTNVLRPLKPLSSVPRVHPEGLPPTIFTAC